MAVKCPQTNCSAHVHAATYDDPTICEDGHPVRVENTAQHVREFYQRVREGRNK